MEKKYGPNSAKNERTLPKRGAPTPNFRTNSPNDAAEAGNSDARCARCQAKRWKLSTESSTLPVKP